MLPREKKKTEKGKRRQKGNKKSHTPKRKQDITSSSLQLGGNVDISRNEEGIIGRYIGPEHLGLVPHQHHPLRCS